MVREGESLRLIRKAQSAVSSVPRVEAVLQVDPCLTDQIIGADQVPIVDLDA